MKYIVKTYDPMDAKAFQTIKDAKQFMIEYAYENDIQLGTLSIDMATISLQITIENEPKIRFERNPINFN
jgi:hypothetical protein